MKWVMDADEREELQRMLLAYTRAEKANDKAEDVLHKAGALYGEAETAAQKKAKVAYVKAHNAYWATRKRLNLCLKKILSPLVMWSDYGDMCEFDEAREAMRILKATKPE